VIETVTDDMFRQGSGEAVLSSISRNTTPGWWAPWDSNPEPADEEPGANMQVRALRGL
jgi:hypothetical protein